MRTRIQKWGNSLGVRIPKALAESAGLAAGTPVEVWLDGDRVAIRPVEVSEYKLEDLLAGVTRENLHDEIPDGGPAGRESW